MFAILNSLIHSEIRNEYSHFARKVDTCNEKFKKAIACLGLSTHRAFVEHHEVIAEIAPTLSNVKKHALYHALNYARDRAKDYHKIIDKTYKQDRNISDDLDGWLCHSDTLYIKNTLGYYGQVWINHDHKIILISSSGTKWDYDIIPANDITNLYGRMHFVKDVWNNLQALRGNLPSQYKRGVEVFVKDSIEELRANLGEGLTEYELHFTGHSLGGELSDLGALYAHKYSNHFKNVLSISIENPGSKKIVNLLAQKLIDRKDLDETFTIEKFAKKCFVINNIPNWVNTSNEQFGRVFIISSNGELPNDDFTFSPTISSMNGCLPRDLKKLVIKLQHEIFLHDRKNFVDIKFITPHEGSWPVGKFTDDFALNIDLMYSYSYLVNKFQTVSNIFQYVGNVIDISRLMPRADIEPHNTQSAISNEENAIGFEIKKEEEQLPRTPSIKDLNEDPRSRTESSPYSSSPCDEVCSSPTKGFMDVTDIITDDNIFPKNLSDTFANIN